MDEPAAPGCEVFDPDSAPTTPVLSWDGHTLDRVGGPDLPARVRAEVVAQLRPSGLRQGKWGVAHARVGPNLDLVAVGGALRVHAVRDGALVRTCEALLLSHAADGAEHLLQAAAAYEALARTADAMAAAGGRLSEADDGFVQVRLRIHGALMPAYDGPGEHAFSAPDGTRLVYRSWGSGAPLVCLPGGPMQASAYLGDLGGLPARHRLILLGPARHRWLRRTPEDPASYRCDRLVGDVEALRVALGLDRVDLLAHSGGASLGLLYAARHPGGSRRLLLVTPGLASVAVPISVDSRLAVAGSRSRETWFPAAFSGAVEDRGRGRAPTRTGRPSCRSSTGGGTTTPGPTTPSRRASATTPRPRPTAPRTCSAPSRRGPRWRSSRAPTMVVAGEYDVNTPPEAAAELAAILPRAELAVLPRAAHYPWRDDPEAFAALASRFIGPEPAARMVR